MSRWDHSYLGHDGFPDGLTELEVVRYFTPTPDELAVIRQRRSDPNRIAFALQLGFLKMTGRALNTVEIVPPAILLHLGDTIGCPAPQIASIRALYRRRRSLFDHQLAAQALLGRSAMIGHAERGLTAYLRREAIGIYAAAALVDKARIWLVDHDYLVIREKDLRRLAVKALRHQERELFDAICAATDAPLRKAWIDRLLEVMSEGGGSFLEWLQAAPLSKSSKALDEQLAKVKFLRTQGAEGLGLGVLPLAGLEHFSRRVTGRAPHVLAGIKEPRRSLELACFLRLHLLRLTDMTLTLVDHGIAAQWREARSRATAGQKGRLQGFRRLLGDLASLSGDESLSADQLREALRGLIAPFNDELNTTQVFAIRKELAQNSKDMSRLIKAARSTDLQTPTSHKLAKAFAMLDQMAETRGATLPPSAANPFGRSWQPLIDQPDRAAALRCYRAATTMLLKRSLKNRSVTSESSIAHRAPDGRLVSAELWNRDRGRYHRDLSMPQSAEKFIQRLEMGLEAGLAALAIAVEAGEVAIDGEGIHLPRRKRQPKDPIVDAARKSIGAGFGRRQLSDVMIEIDSLTHFSWTLLGRPANSEAELVTLYTALLALGSDLTVSDLGRMIPTVDGDGLGRMVQKLQSEARLRAANNEVVAFLRKHRVATLWGDGVYASADMMSLDATRRLWNSRLDPRRKGHAIGTYPHVLDQWAIFYDQPIVLNRRQAGAAIEGALRQTVVEKLERVAVDTHGFTHFAMALAKIVGFDLCPRLAGLNTRKLFLPRGFQGVVPDVLKPIVAPDLISRKVVARGWDGLMRLGASVKDGWYPATDALEHYGSAAQGDHVYDAGVGVGKLLRTVYLCDYLSITEFRRTIEDLQNQGEAVHSLQRKIHDGAITAKLGRSPEQMIAISGALTLLTNVVMAWNTHHIQAQADQSRTSFPDNLVSHIAPIAHAHINMCGIISFDFSKTRSVLLGVPPAAAAGRL
jgi:TnpA family transposase